MMDSVSGDKKKKMYGKYDEYEVKDWARTLTDAEEIKKDPEKLKYVKMCLKKKKSETVAAIESLDDLRKIANEMNDEN